MKFKSRVFTCSQSREIGELEHSGEEFIHWGEPQLSGEEESSWLVVERSQLRQGRLSRTHIATVAAAYPRADRE